MLVIGGSAGSIDVLLQVLPGLNTPLRFPVIIVLHRRYSETSSLDLLLASRTGLVVKEPEDKEEMENGTVYLAPADYHLLTEHNRQFSLDYSEKVNFSRPSIDVTFQSAAEVFGTGTVGILLSGANADGVSGLLAIRRQGGYVVVQDPQTAQTPFMPRQAIEAGLADKIMNPEQLTAFINSIN